MILLKFFNEKTNPDNLMLLNMHYSYGNKDNDYTDSLEIIYRDLRTGNKKIKTIKRPEVEIYFTKEEYRDYTHNMSEIEIDKTDALKCQFRSIPWTIAKHAGPNYVESLKQLYETGRRSEINKIQFYPYVFGSDMDCESYYRINWLLEYDNDKPKHLTKAYFDIEVDTISIEGFPKDGECPVNIITLVNDENKSVYTFILNNPDNPQIIEYVNNIENEVKEIHDTFDEIYGVLDYNLYIYDDERDLIRSFFNAVHALKPDFIMGWNIFGFDVPYLIARAEILGMDVTELFTHPDFFNRTWKFVPDKLNFNMANKSDRLEAASYTKWIDHCRLYSATRKGTTLSSFKLNDIGRDELNDEKIDYTEIANIKTLPYVNFKLFVLYNIKDVLLEYGIENKTNDLDNLYISSYTNCTAYDKVFKQTFILKRRAYYEYMLQGYILGNNVNIYNQKTDKFKGACVADPMLNDHNGVKLLGSRSMFIFDFVMDMDFSAMYPHITVVYNIERSTMIGKLIIVGFDSEPYDHIYTSDIYYDNTNTDDDMDEDEFYDEPESIRDYDAGGDFVECYLSGDLITMGKRFFNLPSYDKILEDFRNEKKIKPRKIVRFIKHILSDIKIKILGE
jgi:DNA polymerase elongation subunit (family B)